MNEISTEYLKKEFGLKLKEIRKLKGYTQEKLSEKIGINLRQLARIEAGESFVTAETLYNICLVLRVNPSQLFDFEIYEEFLKTGTENIVHFSAIKSGNTVTFVNNKSAQSINNKEIDKMQNIDTKMQEAAKKLNQPVTVDEISDGIVVATKKYFPNGEVKIDKKTDINSEFTKLKENINSISSDVNKTEFINLAFDALTSAESLQKLKLLISGLELAQKGD